MWDKGESQSSFLLKQQKREFFQILKITGSYPDFSFKFIEKLWRGVQLCKSMFSLSNLKPTRIGSMSRLARHEAFWGLFFLSPWIIGFFLWIFIPMIASFIFSFTHFNLIHPEDIEWVGLSNYFHFFRDPVVLHSVMVSLRFALIAIPIAIIQPILMP